MPNQNDSPHRSHRVLSLRLACSLSLFLSAALLYTIASPTLPAARRILFHRSLTVRPFALFAPAQSNQFCCDCEPSNSKPLRQLVRASVSCFVRFLVLTFGQTAKQATSALFENTYARVKCQGQNRSHVRAQFKQLTKKQHTVPTRSHTHTHIELRM